MIGNDFSWPVIRSTLDLIDCVCSGGTSGVRTGNIQDFSNGPL